MLLSIIIPVFNQSIYLRKCLDSIIGQKGEKIEIILIDDCSTDDSLQIMHKYEKKDSRIKVFKNLKKSSIGTTRNKGVKLACGEYLWFIDSDDWIKSNAISIILNQLKDKNSRPSLIITGHIEHYSNCDRGIRETKIERLPYIDPSVEDTFLNFIQLTKGVLSFLCIYLFSKKIIINQKILFQENVHYEDIVFCAKAVYYSSNTFVIPKLLYNYNREEHNSITQSYSKEKIYSLLSVYETFYKFLKKERLLPSYENTFAMRFLVFCLGPCFYFYSRLKKKDQKDDKLKTELQSYLDSETMSENNILTVANFIKTIDEKDNVTKKHYINNLRYINQIKKIGL